MTYLIFNSRRQTPDNKGERSEFTFNSSAIKTRNKNKNKIKGFLKVRDFYQKSDLPQDRQNKAGIKILEIPKTGTAIAISISWIKSHDGLSPQHAGPLRNHVVMISQNKESLLLNQTSFSTPLFSPSPQDTQTSEILPRQRPPDPVLVAVIVQYDLSLTPILFLVFFGEEQ